MAALGLEDVQLENLQLPAALMSALYTGGFGGALLKAESQDPG